jgi:hypothetical protein
MAETLQRQVEREMTNISEMGQLKNNMFHLDESHVEKKLIFLAESDKTYALLYAAKDAHKDKLKLLKAKAFLESTGSVAERNAEADCHPDVARCIEEGENVLADFKLLEAERARANTVIEVWRSLNASRRRT